MTLFHFIYTQTMCHNRYNVILIINAIKLPKLQKMIKNKPTKQNICHKKKRVSVSSAICIFACLLKQVPNKFYSDKNFYIIRNIDTK